MTNTTEVSHIPPIDGCTIISSEYEVRNDPEGGTTTEVHAGNDYAAPKGTDVNATAAGKVIFKMDASRTNGWGNVVVIEHTYTRSDGTIETTSTLYAHLDSFADIKVGDYVEQGEYIGDVGNTGRSVGQNGGYHLHYAILNETATKNIESAWTNKPETGKVSLGFDPRSFDLTVNPEDVLGNYFESRGATKYICLYDESDLLLSDSFLETVADLVAETNALSIIVNSMDMTDPDNPLIKSTTEYVVKTGDTISSIAKEFGITIDELKAANPDLADSTYTKNGIEYIIIEENQQLAIPITSVNYSTTITGPDGSFSIWNYEEQSLTTYTQQNGWLTTDLSNISGTINFDFDSALKEATGLGNYGNYDGTSTIDNSLFDLNINIGSDSNNATKDTDDYLDGLAIAGGDYSGVMSGDVLNGDGLTNTSVSQIVTDNYRPGAETLADDTVDTWLDKTIQYLDTTFVDPVVDLATDVWNGITSVFSSITNLFTQAPYVENVDPLVLDLNNNGIELISYEDSTVSFDVDGDGYKENTGWVSGTDGIVVHDKNGDGVINDITETILFNNLREVA